MSLWRLAGFLLVAGASLGPGALGGPGAAAQGLRSPVSSTREAPSAATVVDAAGREIGPVADISPDGSEVVAVLKAQNRTFLVRVIRDRILQLVGLAQFASADCTGPPHLLEVPVGSHLTSELPAVSPLNELLVANGPPEPRIMASEWDALRSPPFCRNVGAAGELRIVRPARVLLDLGTFSPPFQVR
jgi:hypothetical protein